MRSGLRLAVAFSVGLAAAMLWAPGADGRDSVSTLIQTVRGPVTLDLAGSAGSPISGSARPGPWASSPASRGADRSPWLVACRDGLVLVGSDVGRFQRRSSAGR